MPLSDQSYSRDDLIALDRECGIIQNRLANIRGLLGKPVAPMDLGDDAHSIQQAARRIEGLALEYYEPGPETVE